MSLPPGPNLAPVDQREAVPDPLPPRPAPVRAAVALMALGGAIAGVDALVKLVLWDRDDLERRLDETGITPGDVEGFFTIVRVLGFVGGLVVAGTWIVHAVAGHDGRRWVRPWAGALATIFVLVNLVHLGDTGSAPGLAYLGLRTAIAVAVVALLWLPASTAFLRAAAAGR